jgi:hypothetical protein
MPHAMRAALQIFWCLHRKHLFKANHAYVDARNVCVNPEFLFAKFEQSHSLEALYRIAFFMMSDFSDVEQERSFGALEPTLYLRKVRKRAKLELCMFSAWRFFYQFA